MSHQAVKPSDAIKYAAREEIHYKQQLWKDGKATTDRGKQPIAASKLTTAASHNVRLVADSYCPLFFVLCSIVQGGAGHSGRKGQPQPEGLRPGWRQRIIQLLSSSSYPFSASSPASNLSYPQPLPFSTLPPFSVVVSCRHFPRRRRRVP